MMTIEALRALLASGQFHHATMRLDGPTLWNGLWIYRKAPESPRGFRSVGHFDTEHPDRDARIRASTGRMASTKARTRKACTYCAACGAVRANLGPY
jgi:hypothetical protein